MIHNALKWEDDGPLWIRGYLVTEPKTTLFLIERNPENPRRGRMTGGVIPDDEDGKGTNENGLLSWLQGCAAPMYLEDFQKRLAELGSAVASFDGLPAAAETPERKWYEAL